MSSAAHAERLAIGLESTGLIQAVNTSHTENQIRVLCRVLPGAEARWLDLLKRLLIYTDEERGNAHSWQAHVCRLYFLKEVDSEKKLVFGWNISIQSFSMSVSLDYMMRIIKGENPSPHSVPGETMEMEFLAAPKNRNTPNPKGKGVHTIDGDKEPNFSPARRGR